MLQITSYIWNILQQHPLKMNIQVSRHFLPQKSRNGKKLNMGFSKSKSETNNIVSKAFIENLRVHCFEQEIKILQECSHPNIIRIISLVMDAHDNVEGMLLEYITNGWRVVSLTNDQYEQWTNQIREAITYLHTKKLICGDVKSGNVLVREDDTVILVDFGGGRTRGWVDDVNFETVQGDWQGYERIMQFLKANIENK